MLINMLFLLFQCISSPKIQEYSIERLPQQIRSSFFSFEQYQLPPKRNVEMRSLSFRFFLEIRLMSRNFCKICSFNDFFMCFCQERKQTQFLISEPNSERLNLSSHDVFTTLDIDRRYKLCIFICKNWFSWGKKIQKVSIGLLACPT